MLVTRHWKEYLSRLTVDKSHTYLPTIQFRISEMMAHPSAYQAVNIVFTDLCTFSAITSSTDGLKNKGHIWNKSSIYFIAKEVWRSNVYCTSTQLMQFQSVVNDFYMAPWLSSDSMQSKFEHFPIFNDIGLTAGISIINLSLGCIK